MQPSAQKPHRTTVSKHESFTRQVSESCKMCQVNHFHCSQCKISCHKKCPGHNGHNSFKNSRSRSYQKIYTGDEHWKKVLQTNDSEIPSCRKHCGCKRLTSPWSDRETYSNDFWGDKVKLNYNNKCDLRYFDYANSREHSTVCSNSSSVSRASSFATHFRSKSPVSSSSFFSRQNSQGRQQSVGSPQKEKNVLSALVTRFVNWIGPNKQDPSKQTLPKPDLKTPSPPCTINQSPSSSKLSSLTLFQPDLHKLEQRRLKRRPKTMTLTMAKRSTAMSTSESEIEAWSPKHNHFHSFTNRWNKVKQRPSSTCSSHFLATPCVSPSSSDAYMYSQNGYLSPTSNADVKKSLFNTQSTFNSNSTFTLPYRNAQSSLKASSDFDQRVKRLNSTSTTSNPTTSSSSSLNSLSSQKSNEEDKDSKTAKTLKSAQDKRQEFKGKTVSKNSFLSKNSICLSKDTLINSSAEKDSVDISDNISMCSLLECLIL